MSSGPGEPRLLPALVERRSLRALSPNPPPNAVLALLFEAARWAPSGGNGQPWRFLITRRGSVPFDSLAASLSSRNGWAASAPLLVLTAVRKEHLHPTKPPRANRLALLELGLALGNLVTQASALGMVAHPMAGFDHDAASIAVGVPARYEVGVLLALGYPADAEDFDPEDKARERRPRSRAPLTELVFEGEWGSAAAFADRVAVQDSS